MHANTLVLSVLASLASAQITVRLDQSYQPAKKLKSAHETSNSSAHAASLAKTYAGTAQNQYSSYTLPVAIGSDGRTYDLIVDTGASTLWAGAHDYRKFAVSNSSIKQKQQPFSENYGSGWVDGVYYKDSVAVGGVTARNQGLGGATDSDGFCSTCHGIIGFGPTDLTSDIVPSTKQIPTFIDTLFAQKQIPRRMVGIGAPAPWSAPDDADFRPTTKIGRQARSNGVITLGGYDTSALKSKMTWLPHIPDKISSNYWNVQLDGISYTTQAKKTYQLTSSPAKRVGMVDSGTTLVLLPADAYGEYIYRTGATVDKLGFVRIKQANVAKLGDLTITMGGTKFVLSPSAQLFPPAIAERFGVNGTDAVSIFGSSGRTVSGLDFILGQMFLERFYAAFDSDSRHVGFAYTSDTFSLTYPALAKASKSSAQSPAVKNAVEPEKAAKAAAKAKHVARRRLEHSNFH